MTPEARRNALAIIAREHVLTRRDALDSLGTPLVLNSPTHGSADYTRLHNVATAILQHLPEDVASSIPDLTESQDPPSIGGFDSDHGVLLWLLDLRAPDGTPWVAFLCGTVYTGTEDGEHDVLKNLNLTVNNLNLNDAATAWVSMDLSGERLLVRLSSAAHPVDEGLERWTELASYMIALALAAGSEEEGTNSPAASYLELLHISQLADEDGYSEDVLRSAATEFRDSFPEELSRTVLLDVHPGGVEVLVPFLADGEVRALLTVFEAVSDTESPTGVGGVKIFGQLYENLPTPEAYKWARAFNGDDVIPDDDNDTWIQTTAWLFGSWQALEVSPGMASVFYKGFVPNPSRRHVSDVELVRGCVREVWVSASRYRLRKEFDSTVGGVDVQL